MKFTASKDVLKQNVDSTTRDITRTRLETVYLKALELPTGIDAPIPEQVSASANAIEKELYKEYSTQPSEYVKQVAKLHLFLDPKHYVGQFAKMFRVKTLQSVYTPDRLIRLDITDMLPEVFLNPKADPAAKLDVYQNINRLITQQIGQLRDQYNSVLNPTARIPTRPRPVRFETAHKLIAKHQTDVKDLCENPYWKMKKVNMIICKENNKFYCLDIEQLLTELAKNNTATNYFTKKPLPLEIIDNIRARYAAEIDEIKMSGEPVKVGSRTTKEILDLEQTVKRLQEFQTVFNQDTVRDNVELFGLNSVEDPAVGGVKNILNNIPAMIQDEFEEALDEKEFGAVVEQINLWLDASIEEIGMIIKGVQEVAPVEEEFVGVKEEVVGEEEEDIEGLLGEEEEDIEKILGEEGQPAVTTPQGAGFVQTHEAEEKLIGEEVLQADTMAFKVYNDYIERLKIANQTVLEDLKTAQDLGVRSKLHEHLVEINAQLREVREKGRTIKGIISLLQSSLNANNDKLEEITEATGMGLLYPQQMEAAQQEKAALEQLVKNLQTEIAYLEELHTTFVEEQEALGNIKEY